MLTASTVREHRAVLEIVAARSSRADRTRTRQYRRGCVCNTGKGPDQLVGRLFPVASGRRTGSLDVLPTALTVLYSRCPGAQDIPGLFIAGRRPLSFFFLAFFPSFFLSFFPLSQRVFKQAVTTVSCCLSIYKSAQTRAPRVWCRNKGAYSSRQKVPSSNIICCDQVISHLENTQLPYDRAK